MKYYLKIFLLSLFSFLLMLAFQNCSPQFELSTPSSDLELLSDSTNEPAISFAPNSPTVFSSRSVEIAFGVANIETSQLRSVSCQLNQEPAVNCDSLSVTFANLADGDHSLRITAETVSNSQIQMTRLFRVDTVLPVVTVSMMPPATTNQTTAQFIFMASDSLSGVEVIECSLNAAPFAVCTSPVNLTSLAVGSHNYRIRARDPAGNLSTLFTHAWTVNQTATTPPNLVSTPAALTNQTTASFSFSGNGLVSFECQLDNGAYASCVSPRVYNNLTSSPHTFRVRGTNGNNVVSDPVQYIWTVDTVVPTMPTLTSSVGAVSTINTASFTFVATDAVGVSNYQCSLNSAAFASCVSPTNLMNLANGSHAFSVRARDGAGNISPVSTFNWTVNVMNNDQMNLAAGRILYANNCAGCHGNVQNTSKRNSTALQITESINDVPAMMGIDLTPLQIEQIARALRD